MNIKKSIFALATAVLPFTAFAQNTSELSINFEDASQYKSIGVYDWWEQSPFRVQPGESAPRLSGNCLVVDNPDKQLDELTQVEANPSAKVLGFERSICGSNMYGARIELKTPYTLGTTTKYVHVKMLRPSDIEGRVMLIGLGKHNAQAVGATTTWKEQTEDIEQFTVIGNQKPTPGYWSDIVFPIKCAGNVDIYSLVVCVDCESPHRLSDDFLVYIDDIEINSTSRPSIALRGDYPVCFDKEVDQQTHGSRMYNNIRVTTNTGTFIKKGNGRMGLTEAFDNFIPVKRGSQVSITPGWTGNSMHSFVYFDANNDGRFDETDSKEFVGTRKNFNATHTFTIPADQVPGVYRIRTKVDWESTDPAGNADNSNFILANGGGMIDALLFVYDESTTVKVSNSGGLNGDIVQADGQKINNLVHTRGTALSVKWLPETGFECAGMTLTVGNIGADAVHGNPQYINLPKVTYRQFDDEGNYTIPAELLYTDLNIEGEMVQTGRLPKPEFIPTSKDPIDGKFRASSRALTLKVKNGYMSTASGYTDTDGYLKLTNATEPTDAKGYWVVCGDDENGYQIYNVEAGTGKVLGFTGSEAGARAKLYDVNSIPANVTTRFDYKASTSGTNPYKAAANRAPARAAADAPQLEVSDFNTTFRLHGSTNNCWNDRNGYLALWVADAAFGNDGSAIVVHDVEYDFENPDNNVTPEPPVTPAVDTYQKGELITAQNALTEGMLVILDVKAKQAPTDAHLYYTATNTTNKFDRNNFKAHTDDHNNQYTATDVWKVVNVAGSADAARFQLQSVSDPTVFLPRGTQKESNNEAANFYLSEATGFAADGITRFALRFDNPGAAQDTYHFNSCPGAGAGEPICFWGYSSTSNDSQGSFAIYKAETGAAPEVSYFSNEGGPYTYWGISFAGGDYYITETDDNNLLKTAATASTSWALVGTAESFKLLSSTGKYVGVNNETKCVSVATDAATEFIIVNEDAEAGTFMIARKSDPNNAFNPWQGKALDHSIGFYTTTDNNDKLVFKVVPQPENPGTLFSSAKTYKFISKRNDGVLYAPESATSNDIVNTVGKGITVDASDAHQQFAIIASPKYENAYYLYSVEANKFFTCPSANTNTHWTLTDSPVQYVTFVDNASNIESHPWFITATDCLNPATKYYAHMGNSGNGWALITWADADKHLADEGNGWKVEEVGEFDADKLKAALEKINLRENPAAVPDPLPLPETTSTVLGGLKLSSATEKHYYVIRNYSKSGDYAHYAGDAAKLSLGGTVDDSAIFYFTQAEGAESTDSRAAVRIYNLGAEQKMMSGFDTWANAPEAVWYVRKASQDNGNTYNICPDANFGGNCWNHQSGGVWTWSADNGSAWYLESPAYSYEIAVNGTDDENAGITYLGQYYTAGSTVEAFSQSASSFTPIKVQNKKATVTVYHGTIYVDYEDRNADTFFTEEGDEPVYHKILFNSNNNIGVGDANPGENIMSVNASSAPYWAFYGDTNAFFLCSEGGHYAKLSGDNNVTTTTNKAEASTFRLMDLGNDLMAIVRPTATGTGFNPIGGMGAGKTIGFYGTGDVNSRVIFENNDGTKVRPVFPVEEYAITGVESFAKPSQHTLWYTSPAPNTYYGWENFSLPLGNGELGGSIFGGVKTEKITFNEKSLWDGASTTRPNGPHGEYLKFGNIWVRDLSSNFDGGVKDYVRYLDIDNAVAGVQYSDAAGTKYTRTYVTSQPDKVMAIRYEADGQNKLNLNFTVIPGQFLRERSKGETPEVTYENGSATFNGRLELLSYAANVSVKADEGAEVISDYRGITVKNASEITVYYAGATDFNAWDNKSGNFVTGGAAQLPADMALAVANASQKGFDAVLADAKDEYHSFYNRVKLDLKSGGSSVDTQKNTYDLVYDYTRDTNGIRETGEGYFLEQLYYNYGRYLLISSNRYAPVPNNLQGLWVDADYGDSSKSPYHSPWNSDIHTNINIQMNYWPAEPNNLSELHEPLLNHIISIAESPGAKAQAQKMNSQQAIQANGNVTDASLGWVINTESNLFGGMSTFAENYTIANAWYCSHLWQHYRYTCDREFLKKAFPAMWGAAQYWVQRLVLSADGKTYECYNEWSPEHGPSENATAHSQQLVRELFDNVLDAVTILGDDANVETEWLNMIQERRSKLDLGLATEKYKSGRIGDKNWNTLIPDDTDILREWKYSAYTVGENAHRHTSHLMALYPFGQVSFFSEEGSENYKLAEAARNSLTQRSDNSTGWAMGWRVNLWARALDGDHARRLINNALRCTGGGGIYYNLWDSHAPFQIDGNFGVCAGISEMLLQSYDGTIHLLPALPTAWSEGSISGLKAVGNFTVDQAWKNKTLTSADITSNVGGKLEVVYNGLKATIENTRRGETYHFDIVDDKLTYNLVDATIVTITDYIDGARNGGSYDAQKLEDYKKVILKK